MTGTCGFDLLLLHQPVQHLGRAIGTVARQPLGLEAKALSRALQHGAGSPHFGLTHGPGSLHIHDHGRLEVDEVVVRIGKERRTTHRTGPLSRRIRG